jgi:CHAD domain-containing protein
MRILTVDLAEWISVGAWWDDDAVAELRASSISFFAGQVLDRLRRRIKRGGRRLEDIDEDARHEVRILAKKLRYSGEFFAGLYPAAKARRRHDHFLAAINKLQSALGDLNDLAIGRALLADLGVAEGEALLAATGKHKPGRLLAKAQNSLDDLIEMKRFWR